MFKDYTVEMMKRSFRAGEVPRLPEFLEWVEPDEDDDFETSACKSFLVLFKALMDAERRISELERRLL